MLEASSVGFYNGSATQVAVFDHLLPNELYNFYVMRNRDTEHALASENLMYMGQATADSTGNLSFYYEPKENVENVVTFVVARTKTDLSTAQISVNDLVYTKEEQFVKADVVNQGIRLTEGIDYELSGDYSATEIGEYTVTVSGIGQYTGAVDVDYKVSCKHVYVTEVTKPSTNTEEGILTYRCMLCGYSYTESIAKQSENDNGNYNGNSGASADKKGTAVLGKITANQALGRNSKNSIDVMTSQDWDIVRQNIKTARDGETITINMNNGSVVPGDVLDSIRGKNITLIFHMVNNIRWNINGKNITKGDFDDIDLDVTIEKKQDLSQLPWSTMGEGMCMKILFAQEGELGYEAMLTINLGKENAGLFANLFFYNQEGALEFVCAEKIDEEGNVTFKITNAMEYTIILREESMENNTYSLIGDFSEENEGTENVVENEVADDSTDSTKEDKELENADAVLWIVLVCASFALCGAGGYVIWRKKKNRAIE